ncbi:MAG: hypothetical protein HY081_08615 [Gammaproteobacteria bacterium]|nr:hypothetical protein [Gammaproteobacteria bacterium]
MGLLEQELILSALLNPAVYGENIDKVEKIETHISCVFLAGAYAYKIKKAINLGFLDFSKLDARHYYCQEELRLNRRFSKTLYLDVIGRAHLMQTRPGKLRANKVDAESRARTNCAR